MSKMQVIDNKKSGRVLQIVDHDFEDFAMEIIATKLAKLLQLLLEIRSTHF